MMRQAGQATPIAHGSDMTAVAAVRGVAACVCACLFSAALRNVAMRQCGNAAMQTAAANAATAQACRAIVVRAALAIRVATPWRAAIG
ncbi:conserved hypothetical protein [Xanthomonas citri pv. fuscans]|nr:conserved hypothetical protein [Xanthomonas citri pv. fuscans]SOO07629.1 conserved hypothetical protein [Xanthomonas citri pv. fuscans]